MLLLCSVGLLLCCAGLSLRAEVCSVEMFPHSVDSVSLATVMTAKEPLLRDDDGCPGTDAKCMTEAYVVQGNVVLAAQTQNVWRCVSYFNGRRQTVGWMRATSLQPTATKTGAGSFVGHWEREHGDSAIDVTRHGTGLHANAMTTEYIHEGDVRTGGTEGALRVSGDRAEFGARGNRSRVCNVHLRLLGDVLLADDGVSEEHNSPCGGMGVTENGVYRRVAR